MVPQRAGAQPGYSGVAKAVHWSKFELRQACLPSLSARDYIVSDVWRAPFDLTLDG
jgi:hypothetical protein